MKIELKENSLELRMVNKLEKLGHGGPTDIVRIAIKMMYEQIRIQEQKKAAEYQKQYSEAEGDEMAVLQGMGK